MYSWSSAQPFSPSPASSALPTWSRSKELGASVSRRGRASSRPAGAIVWQPRQMEQSSQDQRRIVPPERDLASRKDYRPPPPVIICGTAVALDAEEEAFLDLINLYRIESGVPPLLGVSQTLETAAREHTHDMTVNNFLDHIGSDGRNPGQRAWDAGYPKTATVSE